MDKAISHEAFRTGEEYKYDHEKCIVKSWRASEKIPTMSFKNNTRKKKPFVIVGWCVQPDRNDGEEIKWCLNECEEGSRANRAKPRRLAGKADSKRKKL
jgi:hypothetical protein